LYGPLPKTRPCLDAGDRKFREAKPERQITVSGNETENIHNKKKRTGKKPRGEQSNKVTIVEVKRRWFGKRMTGKKNKPRSKKKSKGVYGSIKRKIPST